jgi:hypothetical protein
MLTVTMSQFTRLASRLQSALHIIGRSELSRPIVSPLYFRSLILVANKPLLQSFKEDKNIRYLSIFFLYALEE